MPDELFHRLMHLIGELEEKLRTMATRPEWVDAKGAEFYFGLKRSHLYQLKDAGKIRSVSLRERGKASGKRVFFYDSIRDFLNEQPADEARQDEAA